MTNDNYRERLSDARTRWSEWQAATCSPGTVAQRNNIVSLLRTHAATRSGRYVLDIDPRDLSAEDVAAFLARPHLSANSKATYHRALLNFFGWLHRTGRIPADPMVGVGHPRGRQGVPNPLTAGEVEALFAGAPAKMIAMLGLALFAGLRAHEVAAFRGDQIRGKQLVLTGKGGKAARLPVAPQLAAIAATMPTEGWWFPSPRGEEHHLLPNYVGELTAAHFRAAGIPQGRIHRLRHTYGTLVHRTHRDILVTQRLLRHASVATTMIYTQVEDEDMRSALSGLPLIAA